MYARPGLAGYFHRGEILENSSGEVGERTCKKKGFEPIMTPGKINGAAKSNPSEKRSYPEAYRASSVRESRVSEESATTCTYCTYHRNKFCFIFR